MNVNADPLQDNLATARLVAMRCPSIIAHTREADLGLAAD